MATLWEESFAAYKQAGVDDEMATFVAGLPVLMASLNICEAAQKGEMAVLEVAQLFFRIGEVLGLTGFSRQIFDMKVESHWQAIAREGLLDDIAAEQKAITVAILNCKAHAGADRDTCLESWLEQRQPLVDRWQEALAELKSAPVAEFAMYSVVLRELSNLARAEVLA